MSTVAPILSEIVATLRAMVEAIRDAGTGEHGWGQQESRFDPGDIDRAADALVIRAKAIGLLIDDRATVDPGSVGVEKFLRGASSHVRDLVDTALPGVDDQILRDALRRAQMAVRLGQQQPPSPPPTSYPSGNLEMPAPSAASAIGDRSPKDAISAAVTGGVEFRVWFGTNRKPVDPKDPGKGFSAERSDGPVHYGRCTVFVPESHAIGSLGSSWIKQVWRKLTGKQDDRLTIRRRDAFASDAFWDGLKRQLAGVDRAKRHAVIFIHGFNVSFDEAALRAAQIGADLGIEGAMAFFSWPSRGKVAEYLADGSSIDASEGAIAAFLADVANRSGADAVHVIAHSMGNRGVLRAVNRIAQAAEATAQARFGQFILAAADVDADVFRELSAAYAKVGKRTTLYVSNHDRALGASSKLARFARVGLWPPVQVMPGIDTVDATAIDPSLLGHGYVAEARPMLTDIHEVMFSGHPPEQRFGLVARQTDAGARYWTFRG